MMEEARDPAIKLFGKTISVPEIAASADSYTIGGGGDDGSGALDGYGGGDEEEVESEGDGNDANSEVQTSTQPSHEPTHQTTTSSPDENSEAPTSCDSEQNSNTQEQEKKRQPSSSQESILKKPDKILPCPRCSSMETKFCYFNNYNVNQPRHFCKNCQRYWTAGGTMRNVPVGSGRRKIKSSAAQYHQVLVSKSLHNPGSDIHSQSILKHFEKQQVFKVNSKENGGLDQIEVEVGESIAMTKEEGGSDWLHVYHPPIACFQGPIWPVSWNSTQWEGFNHGVGPNRFSLGFYPAGAYWGCSVPAGSWASSSIQLVPPSSVVQSPGYQSITSSGPSLTLGKHSRDGSILRSSSGSVEGAKDKDNDNDSPSSERCLWVPKTLRIVDDPEEAAKSSIWTSLGIMNRKSDSICAGGIFKACFEKVDDESRYVKNFRTLEVNPAALSRSQALNESSGLG